MKSWIWGFFQVLLFAGQVFALPLHCEENALGNAIPVDDHGKLGSYYFADMLSCRAAISEASNGLICVAGAQVGLAQPYSLAQHSALGAYAFQSVDTCVKSVQRYDGQFVCLAAQDGVGTFLYDVIQALYVDNEFLPTLDSCLQDRPAVKVVESRRMADGSIVLESSSCDLLNPQSAALIQLSKRVGEAPAATVPACQCQGDECSVRIDPIAPSVLQKMEDVVADFDGPNCWNTSLVVDQLVPNFRYANEAEMKFWLNSPLCRELDEQEIPSPGDIIEIRNSNQREIHGFIYLTPTMGFSKDGMRSGSPYFLQTQEEIYDIYQVPDTCRRAHGFKAGCAFYANYYTCQTYSKYTTSLTPMASSNFIAVQKQIDNLEQEVSELALHGRHMTQPMNIRSRLYIEVQTLSTAVNGAAAPDAGNLIHWNLWKSLSVRLNSFYDQLNMIH
jgi:hypothetical protein